MENLTLSKISSKGQILIPKAFRKNFNCGDKVLLFKKNNRIIIDKGENLIKRYKEELEDLDFAKKTEKAWKEIKKGKGIKFNNFNEAIKFLDSKN